MASGGTDPRIRVLLADDHAIVRTGTRRALDPHHDIVVVGEASNGREVLAHPALGMAEVLVLDLNMPDTDVLRLVPECRQRAPRLRVLLFTMHPEDEFAVAALRAGAVGFVGKEQPVDDLVHAVRKVGRGGTQISEVLAARLLGAPSAGAMPHESLSARERQIFDRLVRGASPGEIGAELGLGSSTVATYMHRIRDKIGVESTFELVQYAFRRKLVS